MLGSSRLLCRTLLLRPRRSRLGRSDLGPTASELHPALKLGHPGVFRPEEVGLVGRHLPYFLWKIGIIKTTKKDSKGKEKYQKLTSAVSYRSTSTSYRAN